MTALGYAASFYYQPNRDNAGYGNTNPAMASEVVALIYSIPKQSLAITGNAPPKPTKKPVGRAPGKPMKKPAPGK